MSLPSSDLRPKLLAMHRQERQAPQLPDVALRRRNRTQRHRLVLAAIVRPAPHLVAQLGAIRVNSIPEAVVGREDLVVEVDVGAEVCVELAYIVSELHAFGMS
jgi:hypothetical protein